MFRFRTFNSWAVGAGKSDKLNTGLRWRPAWTLLLCFGVQGGKFYDRKKRCCLRAFNKFRKRQKFKNVQHLLATVGTLRAFAAVSSVLKLVAMGHILGYQINALAPLRRRSYSTSVFFKLIWRAILYPSQCWPRSMSQYGITRPHFHDDVIKWKHLPRYWPFVRGIHRSPVNSPHKGPWRGALMFTLIWIRINGWVNNHEAGDLRRPHFHDDVIIMLLTQWDLDKIATILQTIFSDTFYRLWRLVFSSKFLCFFS